MWAGQSSEEQVQCLLAFLKQGSAHTSSRLRADGRVIEVQGNPMPNGGFVMSFSDITVFREAEQALKQANENLEELSHKTHGTIAALESKIGDRHSSNRSMNLVLNHVSLLQ